MEIVHKIIMGHKVECSEEDGKFKATIKSIGVECFAETEYQLDQVILREIEQWKTG